MRNNKKSTDISITVCFILAGILAVLIIAGPVFFEFYMSAYRGFKPGGEAMEMLKTVFSAAFYPSAVFAAVILYSLIKLLFNIRAQKIFIDENVKYLRVVSICCFVISAITLVAAFFYMPFGFVALAGGFVGLLLRVLKNVMQSAVELRQENDLTI